MEIIQTDTASINNPANFISIFKILKNQYVELTVATGTKAYVVKRDNKPVFQEISETAKFNSKLSKKEDFTIAIIDFREKTAKWDNVKLPEIRKVRFTNSRDIWGLESISFTITYKMTKTAQFKHFVEDLLSKSQYKEVPSNWFIDESIKEECINKVKENLLKFPEDKNKSPELSSTTERLTGGIEIPQISIIDIFVTFNISQKPLAKDDSEQIDLVGQQKKQITNINITLEIAKHKIRATSPDFRLKVITELKQLKLDSATSKKVLNIFFEEELASDLSNEMEEM